MKSLTKHPKRLLLYCKTFSQNLLPTSANSTVGSGFFLKTLLAFVGTVSSHLTASGAAYCLVQEPCWVRPEVHLTHYSSD